MTRWTSCFVARPGLFNAEHLKIQGLLETLIGEVEFPRRFGESSKIFCKLQLY